MTVTVAGCQSRSARRSLFQRSQYRGSHPGRRSDLREWLDRNAPHETQTYTLTLAPTATGTYQLTGWTTQPIAGGSGGTVQTVTITVTP